VCVREREREREWCMGDHTHLEKRVNQVMKRFEKGKIGIAYQSANGAENILNTTNDKESKSEFTTVGSTS
jgi:hypothetical protein